MSTCEAPIALATSKHTKPIGPAERRGGISAMSAAEVHSTHDRILLSVTVSVEQSHEGHTEQRGLTLYGEIIISLFSQHKAFVKY